MLPFVLMIAYLAVAAPLMRVQALAVSNSTNAFSDGAASNNVESVL